MIEVTNESRQPEWLVPHDEPVVQAAGWKSSYRMPVYGDAGSWDLTGLGGPAKGKRAWGRVYFDKIPDPWTTLARQLAFCMLNPHHRILRQAEIHVRGQSYSPITLRSTVSAIVKMESWARDHKLPCNFELWSKKDFCAMFEAQTTEGGRRIIFDLHGRLMNYGRVLSAGPPPKVVWTKSQKASVFPYSKVIKTQPIDPDVWKATLNAAVTYVEVFSGDILEGIKKRDRLFPEGFQDGRPVPDRLQLVRRWLAEESNMVPIHPPTKAGSYRTRCDFESSINFRLLSMQVSNSVNSFLFSGKNPEVAQCREAVVQAAQDGRTVVGGLGVTCALINGAPWHDDFSPRTVNVESSHLRTACYIVVAALTLMRDSEVQEIQSDSIVSYYGAAAVRSGLWKHRKNAPKRYWWIHPVAAQAIEVAEELSIDDDYIFASTTRTGSTAGFNAPIAIDRFVEHISNTGKRTGLAPIETKIRPHQFRRTMAVIVGQQPGAELALGLILKHATTRALSNATSMGYSSPNDAWAREFEFDRADAAAGRHIDEWLASPGTSRAVAGPGSVEYNKVFDTVQSVSQTLPTFADRSELRALLVGTHPNFRIGPINSCLGDRDKAACLNALGKDDPHRDVDPLSCTPAVCSQSVVTQAQLPIWVAEEKDLYRRLRQTGISETSELVYRRRLSEVQPIIKAAAQSKLRTAR